jgi:hypothetical protein
MKLDVELRDEKINGLQRELEELQLGGANEVCFFLYCKFKIMFI